MRKVNVSVKKDTIINLGYNPAWTVDFESDLTRKIRSMHTASCLSSEKDNSTQLIARFMLKT